MLRFISFGSGSSGNCYFLFTENDGLLIDIGVGIRGLKKMFRDYGLNFQQIRHVLITHDHADHIKSVGSISHEYHLPIYATTYVHNGIDRNYCVTRKVKNEYRRYVNPEQTMQIGSFTVTPFTVPHDSTDNVGYEITFSDTTFCLITDAGLVTDSMAEHIAHATHLVIEANHDVEMLRKGPYPQYLKDRITKGTGHLNNKACGEAIVKYGNPALQHVWLCHLSAENNHPELARKTVENVLSSHGIQVGESLQLDVLNRTKPTGIFDL